MLFTFCFPLNGFFTNLKGSLFKCRYWYKILIIRIIIYLKHHQHYFYSLEDKEINNEHRPCKACRTEI
jgi:hypothetical protein